METRACNQDVASGPSVVQSVDGESINMKPHVWFSRCTQFALLLLPIITVSSQTVADPPPALSPRLSAVNDPVTGRTCLPKKPHGRWILGQPFSTTARQRARARLLFCSSRCLAGERYLRQIHSVSFLSSLIVPQRRESGCYSKVAMMQSTDNRNRNQATRCGHGFRFGKRVRCITV